MRTIRFIAFSLLITVFECSADQDWPWISSLQITDCKALNGLPCALEVFYQAGPTILKPTPSDVPIFGGSLYVIPYGIHCGTGDAPGRFKGCLWERGLGHSPSPIGKCERVQPNSFRLTSDSTCSTSLNRFGWHSGSAPGAECVLFGVFDGQSPKLVKTPMGYLTADQVANSGNTYCVKPTDPGATCEIWLNNDGVLDHGIVPPNSSSQRTISLVTNCGDYPRINIIGGNKITLGPGVTTDISFFYGVKDLVTLTSQLRTANATPGAYRASFVVVVSPN